MKKLLLIAALAMKQFVCFAQDAAPDPTFNQTGTGLRGLDHTSYRSISDIKLLANGQMMVSGDFTYYNGARHTGVVRLNADGSLDNSFKLDIKSYSPLFLAGEVTEALIQSDGKVIIYGEFDTVGGVRQQNFARLNSDGSRDASFNIDLDIADEWAGVDKVILRPDGKLYVKTYNINPLYNGDRFYRFLPDGTKDNSFQYAGSGFKFIDMYPDGKFLTVEDDEIRRYNADGTLDNSFPVITAFSNSFLTAFKILSDGSFIVGGWFTEYLGQPCKYLARFNSNGTFDNTFQPENVDQDYPMTIGQQADGKILVASASFAADAVFKRLHANGKIDSSFLMLPSDFNSNGGIKCFAIQPDHKIVAGGPFEAYRSTNHHTIMRLKGNTTGIEDIKAGQFMIQAFPSPATDVLNIKVNGLKSATVTLSICDAAGRIIRQWTDDNNGEYHKAINISDLQTGQYLLHINRDFPASRQFIITR